MICNPTANSQIGIDMTKGTLEVKGVCWSGGGRGVHRCDVSIDGGYTFTAAELYKPDAVRKAEKREGKWGWYHFSKVFDLSDEQKAALKRGDSIHLELVSKAVNGDFNVQPERPEPYFNARGVTVNHMYRVPITINPSLAKGEKIIDTKRDIDDNFRNKPTGGSFIEPWGEPHYEGDHPHVLDAKAGKTHLDPLWTKKKL